MSPLVNTVHDVYYEYVPAIVLYLLLKVIANAVFFTFTQSSSLGVNSNTTPMDECSYTVSVLIFYDHLLEFSREVDLFWTRLSLARLSYPTILYLLTRFTLPIAYLINLNYDLRALQVSICYLKLTSRLPDYLVPQWGHRCFFTAVNLLTIWRHFQGPLLIATKKSSFRGCYSSTPAPFQVTCALCRFMDADGRSYQWSWGFAHMPFGNEIVLCCLSFSVSGYSYQLPELCVSLCS